MILPDGSFPLTPTPAYRQAGSPTEGEGDYRIFIEKT